MPGAIFSVCPEACGCWSPLEFAGIGKTQAPKCILCPEYFVFFNNLDYHSEAQERVVGVETLLYSTVIRHAWVCKVFYFKSYIFSKLFYVMFSAIFRKQFTKHFYQTIKYFVHLIFFVSGIL